MSIAAQAGLAQASANYRVDEWFDAVLPPMTKVWQGIGGHSDFFLSEEDAREASGAYLGTTGFEFAETLWRLAQAQPSRDHGYREGIRELVVDVPTPCALGIVRANVAYGTGSVFQYFIPNWSAFIYPTGRRHQFRQRDYPKL